MRRLHDLSTLATGVEHVGVLRKLLQNGVGERATVEPVELSWELELPSIYELAVGAARDRA